MPDTTILDRSHKHCWHLTHSGAIGNRMTKRFICCYCGETKTETYDMPACHWQSDNPADHGPYCPGTRVYYA